MGEILRVRAAYTTSGQVNQLATKQRDAAFSLATGTDGAAELSLRSQSWSPDSQWAIFDGLEAVKWAFVFAGYTDCDEVADNWVERFRCMVRLRADRLDFVKAVYDAASWRLTFDMRGGFSFEAATKAISHDTPWLSAFEGQYRAPAQDRGERPERGDRRHQERGDRQQDERSRKSSRSRRRSTRSPKRSEKDRGRRSSPPPWELPTGARPGEASWVHACGQEHLQELQPRRVQGQGVQALPSLRHLLLGSTWRQGALGTARARAVARRGTRPASGAAH